VVDPRENDKNENDPSDPFSDWSKLMHKPVLSTDRKKIGFLRMTLEDYMIVKKGLITLNKYFIPKLFAESIDRKGNILLSLNAYEVKSTYSYSKMKHTLTSIENRSERQVTHRPIHDRIATIKHGATRNRIAAGVAFVSGFLFLISGYKANLVLYEIAARQIFFIESLRDFWNLLIIPIGALALLSQLGGFTVLIGAGLFAANRVNLGKLLIMVGTGQGLITIGVRIISELWLGHMASLNNYVLWLTSSAAGLGILFAILSQSISKGSRDSVASKVFRTLFRVNRR
jgi:hypothetical protein